MLDSGGIQELCTAPGSCLWPALGVSLLETAWRIRAVRGVSWAFRDKKSKFSRRVAWEVRPQEAPTGSEVKNKNMTGKGRHPPRCLAWRMQGRGWLETRQEVRGPSRWCAWLPKEEDFALAHGIHPLHHHSHLLSTQLSPSLDPPVPCSHLQSSLSRLSRRELCTADWPQCSCDHHQARRGVSVSVRMPGLC